MNEIIREIAADEQQKMIKKYQAMLEIEQLAAAVREAKLAEALRATLTALNVAAIDCGPVERMSRWMSCACVTMAVAAWMRVRCWQNTRRCKPLQR